MRVLICGVDGYLGWSFALHMAAHGHEVGGIDNFARRGWVEEVGSDSLIPIQDMPKRQEAFKARFGRELRFWRVDLTNYNAVASVLKAFQPDAIMHFAEMPSAPYSMIDAKHAAYTHTNNLVGTLNLLFAVRDLCPDVAITKVGTMGEYGTPNVDIPEGQFELEFRGRKARMMFPRQPGSFYHCTKVHDTINVEFACRVWGLRSTDIMQGVVYGTRIDAMGDDPVLRTRFDYDECLGTFLNRACAQAVLGHPLTVYGKGNQQRGFLPLRDSMECFRLVVENPPGEGEYRVFNQFEKVYSINELAARVRAAAVEVGLEPPEIKHYDNPRVEAEEHYYSPDREGLLKLGYTPTADMHAELVQVLRDLVPYRERIRREVVLFGVRW